MSDKKKRPGKGAQQNKSASNFNTKSRKIGSYLRRTISALLTGKVDRSDLDKLVGTTNSPMFILGARELGLKIKMEKIFCKNRDGRQIWRGRYSLNPESRALANQLLERGAK